MPRIVLALLVVITFAPFGVAAQTSIGIVDDQKILFESKAAHSIQEQVKSLRAEFRAEFSKKEQALLDDQRNLGEERGELPQEEFTKKVQAFEKRSLEVQREVQKKKRMLDRASMRAVSALRVEFLKIVEDIIQERGFQLVLTNQNVILGEKSIDITDEVMARINKALTHIDVKLDDEDM